MTKRCSVQRLLAIVCSLCLLLGGTVICAGEENALDGVTRSGCRWELDLQTGTLTLSDGLYVYAGEPYENYKEDIRHLVIKEPVVSISTEAFNGYSHLESVDMADTVTYIGGRTFAKCTSLTSVKLSQQTEIIGVGAFMNTGIESIILPDSLKRIYSRAFEGSALRSIVIPAGVEYLSWRAFFCPHLTSAVIRTGYIEDYSRDAEADWDDNSIFSPSLTSVVLESPDFPIGNAKGVLSYRATPRGTYYAPAGGTVENYCRQKGWPFVPLETLVSGDLDGDGELKSADVRKLLHLLASDETIDSRILYCVDLDKDGAVTSSDARCMMQLLVESE